MNQENLLGVDIGGTKISLTLGTFDGVVLKKYKFKTQKSWQENVSIIQKELSRISKLSTSPIMGIGISCGGPLDSEKGRIYNPPNLPGWDNVPVTEILSDALGIPAFLENDANACALAEWRWGAGQGCRNMIFLTFGTGLGAGLILDGQLYAGTNGLAGEFGHIRLSADGPSGYGKNGSWEGWCSGSGLADHFRKEFGVELSGREICALALQGDARASRVIQDSARYLGQGLSILIDILNPERIVIGSIFTRDEALFRPIMESTIFKEALPETAENCEILPAALSEELGDLAALGIAASRLSNRQLQKDTE